MKFLLQIILLSLAALALGHVPEPRFLLNAYNDLGPLVTTTTDPVNVVTTVDFDTATATFPRRKYFGTLANNLIEYFLYDPRTGELAASTNMQGLVASNAFDGLLRTTDAYISTAPNGPPTLKRAHFDYSLGPMQGGGPWITINYVHALKNDPASASGFHETYTYLDGFRRPIQVRDQAETNGQYRVSDVLYDARGKVAAEMYPVFQSGSAFVALANPGQCVWTKFDPIGRVIGIYPCATASFTSGFLGADPTPLSGDGGSPVGPTTIQYGDGNTPWALLIFDPRNKERVYYLDAFGQTNRIVEHTANGNFTSTLGHNPVGDLTNITDSASNSIGNFYNLLGEKVGMADPDMGYWQWALDAAGRPKVQTDAKQQQIRMFYNDPAGRPTRREGWNAAGQLVSTNIWLYDSNGGDSAYTVYPGQLFEEIDDEGWTKHSWDVRGRPLKSVRYLSKNGQTYTNLAGFDDADRPNSTTYPNGGPTLTNLFDTAEHLKQVKRVDSGGTNMVFYTANGFDQLNRLNGVSFGNGAASSFGFYSISKRLNKIVTTIAGGTTIQSLTNRYDEVGNVLGVQDLVASHTNAASATILSALYDDLNRMILANWAGYGQKNYGYTPIGNVLTNGESGTSNYVYGTIRPHCVRSANGVWYTYDQNGNAVFRGGQRLDYDVNNRLWRVIGTNGVPTFFGYAGDGSRLWEQTGTNALHVWIGDSYEERDGKVLFHISAGGHRVCTFEPAAAGVTGYNPTNQEFYFYHPDYLGSSSLMTERNGTQVQHYEYSAFGQSRFTLSSRAFHVSKRYTGQILDEDTGLYYYNFRYYIPELARFGQPDDVIPDLSNPQSYNRYSYCLDNPLRFTDPTGHETYWEGVGNVFLGYYDAGAGVVKGTVFVFAHPITTVEGLGTAVAHPISTGEAIATGVAADWNSGTRGQGKLVGGILIAVGAAVAPAAEAGNLSKAGEIANVGSKVE